MKIKILGKIFEIKVAYSDVEMSRDYVLGIVRGIHAVMEDTECYYDHNDKDYIEKVRGIIEEALPNGYSVDEYDEKEFLYEF